MDAIFAEYGPIGILCGVILALYLRQNKRMQELEDQITARHEEEIRRLHESQENKLASYRDLIKEYVDLVEHNTAVIGKLTTCIESFKTMLEGIKDRLKS
jgi:uncharacterized protein YaaR (DUF327 family)